MTEQTMVALEGGEAVASVAFRTNEVIAIYPITPSSTMGEYSADWESQSRKNIWGDTPSVVEMQSEGGAAGACHGALEAGALSTTFTASQGLLLMIPNMYKIAGELTPFCMHVSARTIATHALSIFGDHSDVMACRQTGFAMLSSGSVQEAHDFAAIAQAATLAARIPFLHFFDGFRTSHEINKIHMLTDDDLRHMIPEDLVTKHRDRALTPDNPVVRGTAQNPDTFFQMQEARNRWHDACPGHVQAAMDKFAARTGRAHKLFEYSGADNAERVIVIMGSGGETVAETAKFLAARGEKVGVVRVRLFRPFSVDALVAALPASAKAIAVLDRTKEQGAIGEPLYQDVVTALQVARARGQRPTAADPVIIGGRYGLSSKEFPPAMVKAGYDELGRDKPKLHFTVGIIDDVTHLSLDVGEKVDVLPEHVSRAMFFGLGSDGTVGANKNSIKIIAENTDLHTQGYFVYDSKKAGAATISHLRFSPEPIKAPYLIGKANFLACHQFNLVEHMPVLRHARQGGVFLLNSPYTPEQTWDKLPRKAQEQIIEKKLKFYVIDATKVAHDAGMGRRINTVMQTCFFAISGVLPRDEAIAHIKKAIEKSYGKKGRKIVEMNFAAVDSTLANLIEMKVPAQATAPEEKAAVVPHTAPEFVRTVTAAMIAGKGESLPVSAFPPDGTWPSGTTQYEKRNLALEIPIWDESLCIQCNKCALVCPHAAIRVKAYPTSALAGAPEGFKHLEYKSKEFGPDTKYTVQVAPEDCTGCTLCVRVCPGKDKLNPERLSLVMKSHAEHRPIEMPHWDFFLGLPEADRSLIKVTAKSSQLLQPLMEFSGACSGCGETPYIKLITQLFGDRTLIANATGCSSIYGGNLPTTPYTYNKDGRGPAWSNSLFEDNAEFGLGFRLSVDQHKTQALRLVALYADQIGTELAAEIASADQSEEAGIKAQRDRVVKLRAVLKGLKGDDFSRLEDLADYLVDKCVWIIGGDGWAYDIGYGGLDHVLASGRNVNILVMDTEVYSNTGGQASKATPLGASAKFAGAGKSLPKKDLGLMAMSYGNVYVASVAFGAKDAQTVNALAEAASYDGPSLVIAYSHCIEHGYDLADALDQQTKAVDAGYWPLYRYDPRRREAGQSPLRLDSGASKLALEDYVSHETRFQVIRRRDPERYDALLKAAEANLARRRAVYEALAAMGGPKPEGEGA